LQAVGDSGGVRQFPGAVQHLDAPELQILAELGHMNAKPAGVKQQLPPLGTRKQTGTPAVVVPLHSELQSAFMSE